MKFIQALLIGASTNIDNFCMAMVIGTRGRRISPLSNFAISMVSGLAAYIASALASTILPASLSRTVGSVIIIGIGVWTVINSLWGPQEGAEVQVLGVKGSLALGMALAVNCLPVAFGAGATGLPPLLTAIFIFVFSYISLAVGVRLGRAFREKFNVKLLNAFSGILLIFLGIAGFFF